MSAIFEAAPGRVSPITAENPRPFILDIGGEFADAIATSVTLDQSVSAQIVLSLANDVFITPFGDNPSTLSVNFILNGRDCSVDSVASFLSAYNATKLGPYQNKEPRLFVVGDMSYEGYIIASRTAVSAEGGQRIMQGSLSAVVWSTNV